MAVPYSLSRPEPSTGSPQRLRPQHPRYLTESGNESSTNCHPDEWPGSRTQGGIFPIAKPALLPWKSAGQFCRSRPGSSTFRLDSTLDSDNEDDMLLGAESNGTPMGFDGSCDGEKAPNTPQTLGRMAQSLKYGLMTPPETPQDEYPKGGAFIAAHEVHAPLSPPETPGNATFQLHTASTSGGSNSNIHCVSPLQKKGHVRFASPARSVCSAAEPGPREGSMSAEGSSFDEDSDDDHFSDASSTISTLDEYGISRPASPKPAPEADVKSKLERIQEPNDLPGFELWTQAYNNNVPRPARAGCAQCLRLNLPCDKAMPSCNRCSRRIAQHDVNAFSSSAPGASLSAAHACCVPMLQTSRHAAAARVIPIFKAYPECINYLPDGEAADAAKADLEARRRAAYDAIVAEDSVRADCANWIAPRPGAALSFHGRGIAERWDGTIVLRRTPGIDGDEGQGRRFVVPMRWQRNLGPASPAAGN